MYIFKKIIFGYLFITLLCGQKFNVEEINKIKKSSNNLVTIGNSKILNKNIDNETYFLGSGDKILINFLSNDIILNNTFTISPSNDLIIPNIGIINVNGLTVSKFIDKINEQCKKKFDIYELNITLVDLRKFNVTLIGLNNNMYNYAVTHVTSVSDLFNNVRNQNNELFSNISDRYITLKRNDISKKIDVFKYNILLEGYNPYLQEGDIIILNVKEKMCSIYGQINNPGSYEVVNNESVSDLIKLAGGFNIEADTNNIKIDRIVNNENKVFDINVIDFDNTFIMANDYILIYKDNNLIQRDYAYITGEINNPGKYPIYKSTTINDLINIANGYTDIADVDKIIINNKLISTNLDLEFLRINNIHPSNRSASEISYYKSRLVLDKGTTNSLINITTANILQYVVKKEDNIYIPSKISHVEILGAVQSPGTYPFVEKYSVLDYIDESGSFTNLSNGNFYIIKSNGEKIDISLEYDEVMDGDIIFVEQKSDVNKWMKFKEIMSVLGQIATLLVVVNQ